MLFSDILSKIGIISLRQTKEKILDLNALD